MRARPADTTVAVKSSEPSRTETLSAGAPRFADRVALVTGASGGIGAAVCASLVSEGAHVVGVFGENPTRLDALAQSLRETPGRLTAVGADLAVATECAKVVSEAAAEGGRLDILVNCAGVTSDGLLLRASPAAVDASLAVNLQSVIHCSRAALKPMLRQRFGRIVSLGSVVAAMGNTGQSVYAAAKAGLEGFTRSLAKEVGRKGVTVNCVSPGLIETEMTQSMDPEHKKRALEAIATGRFGTPEDVAAAVAFLCAQEASYVTGAVLQVNGGMYM